MTFYEEQTGYEKTALSDLQGSWNVLRDSVVESHPFPESHKLLFHIDEAMSWENVRRLGNMQNLLILIRNISVKANVSDEIAENIENVANDLQEVFEAIRKGEVD